MRIRWRNFELPSSVILEKESQTEEYGRFAVEPFERGFGHTIGNGLRRVLLSSIEGTAITAVKIEGASHEFDSLDGVLEDVTDIILNLKRLRFKYTGDKPITCRINASSKGPVTGEDVECENGAEVVNKDLHLATLTMEGELQIEMDVRRGRGYVPSEENAIEVEGVIGMIPVDSIYSPVLRVRYSIEQTRVGKLTNYDRLIVEIWTDGTITPEMSLVEAAKIYRKHLNPFVLQNELKDDVLLTDDPINSEYNQSNREVSDLEVALDRSLLDLELSVRARNCLDGANLQTIRDLVSLSEQEVMNLKNLGKTSLTEIKSKLTERGLALGMAAE